jgi:hypothetical protein
MGFFSKTGSILNTIGTWVKVAAKPIVETVKQVSKWVHDVAEVTDAHLEGKEIVFNKEKADVKTKTVDTFSDDRPDFLGESDNKIIAKIKESERALIKLDKTNIKDHHRLSLQIEVMELVISSQTFNRFANNIRLHEANLQIHYQTIVNTLGLVNDLNRQRLGLKATIKQLNQVIYILQKGKVDNDNHLQMIQNIDLDIKPGSISIAKAYEAFSNTRNILIDEIQSFLEHIRDQELKVRKIREYSENVPEKQRAIESWIDRKIIPLLERTEKQSEELLSSVRSIPLLEKKNTDKIKELSSEESEYKFDE